MAFDPTTAKPADSGKFDPMSARPGGAFNPDTAKPYRPNTLTQPKTPLQRLSEGMMDREREVMSGATFGLSDEMTAGLSGVLSKVTGGGPGYSETLQSERTKQKDFENKHPVESFAEGALGTALNPLTTKVGKFIEGGPNGLARAGRTVLGATGIGGAMGYGSGEGQHGDVLGDSWDRLKNAAWTGALSGALSPLFPAVGLIGRTGSRAAQKIGSALWNKFTDLTGKTPAEAAKTMSPQTLAHYKDIAAEAVENLIKSSGKTPEKLTQDPAFKQGKPITAGETIGSAGEAQQASLARRSGTTGDETESLFRQRQQERPGRVQEDLAKAASLAPEKIEQTMDELSDDLRAKNQPLYDKAEAHPDVDIAGDKTLKDLFSRPSVQRGLKEAEKIASERGIPWAYGGEHTNMTWKNLDLLKRTLGAMIGRLHKDAMGRSITDDMSRADINTVNELRDHLFKLNPDYKTAVDKGGDVIRLEKAYMDAPNLMSGKVSEYQFDKKLNEMSPADIEALKHGWVKDTFDKIQTGKLRLNDIKTGNFAAKARRLLGESQARDFIAKVEQEARLAGAESSIPPRKGSATAKLLTSKEELDNEVDEKMHQFTDNLIRRGWKVSVARTLNNIYFDTIRAAKTHEQEEIRNEIGKMLNMRPDQLQAELAKPRGATIKNARAKDIGRAILSLSSTPASTEMSRRLVQ
jgi:hypothetical protein